MVATPATPQFQQPRFHWSFAIALVIVVGIVTSEQFISPFMPISFWVKLHLGNLPFKTTVTFIVITVALSIAIHYSLKTRDFPSLLLILIAIALQTNGIKLGGLDLVNILPFIILFYILAEALRSPTYQIAIPGVIFFGLLLLLLDLPYITTYSPGRFIINLYSVFKVVLIAFAVINLIRDETHLKTAIKALIIVAIASSVIGIAQYGYNHFTGHSLSLVSEKEEMKPTFLGYVVRATALTTWSTQFADFMVLALPFLLFGLFNAKSGWVIFGYLFAITLNLGANFFAFTYASYFAAGIILLLFPFVYWPRKTIHFMLTILFIGLILYSTGALDWLYEHFLYKIQTSSGMVERKTYLQSALKQIDREPWLGSSFFSEEDFSENFWRKRVHNTGLQVWVALGLPGLLVYLTMLLTLLTQLWLFVFSSCGTERQIFQALALGLIGQIVNMFAESNLASPITWYFLGLCQAAILVYSTARYRARRLEVKPPFTRAAPT